jgi:hypothetical protein
VSKKSLSSHGAQFDTDDEIILLVLTRAGYFCFVLESSVILWHDAFNEKILTLFEHVVLEQAAVSVEVMT